MNKIFETSFETGSLISKQGDAGTPAGGWKFARTEKGLAWEGNGTNTEITWGIPGPFGDIPTDGAIRIVLKFKEIGNDQVLFNYEDASGNELSVNTRGGRFAFFVSGGSFSINQTDLKNNVWYEFIGIWEAYIPTYFYINSIAQATVGAGGWAAGTDFTIGARTSFKWFNGYIQNVTIWDHTLTAQERAKELERFLKASPRGIELYPKPVLPERKPTDLSRYVDTGLCLSYNCIPSAGARLVDTSNQNATGAIYGASEILEGLNFDGKDDYVAPNLSIALAATIKTICFRIKLASTTEMILDGDNTGSLIIDTNAGTLQYPAYDNAFIDGVDTDTIFADQWTDVVITSSTAVDNNTPTLGRTTAAAFTYGKFEIADLQYWSVEFTLQDAKDYHNSFVKPVLGRIPSVYDPVGSTSPFGCIKGTGSFVVDEIAIAGINNYVSDFSTDVDGWNGLAGRNSVSRVASYAGKLNVLKVTQLIDDTFLTINHATTSVWNTLSGWYKLSFCYYIPIGGDDTEKLYLHDGNIILPYEDPAGKAGQWNYYETFISPKERNSANNYIRLYRTNHVPVDDVIYFHDIKIEEILPLPELDSGAKFLRVTGAGIISVPTKQAYGTWEGMIYKGDTANRLYMILIANKIGVAGYVQGYALNFDNDEGIYLEKYDGVGGTTVLFATAVSYITINTWYKYRFTRTLNGVMTLLLKGGALVPTAGYDGWTLAAPTGAYVNPTAADNTYTTCEYSVIDGGVLDRVILDHTDNGVKQ